MDFNFNSRLTLQRLRVEKKTKLKVRGRESDGESFLKFQFSLQTKV